MSEQVTLHENKTPETRTQPQRYLKPFYEVREEKDAYHVSVFMPGVAKNDVRITLEKDRIFIEGSRRDFAESSWKPVFREIPDADYRLQLELNVDIDEGSIEARTDMGVLDLRLPVAEAARPRTIAVE